MIDTNTVSYIVKGSSPASRAKLAGLQDDEIACISAITEAELIGADAYEVSDYKRILVRLKSGVEAWVYVKN